MFNKKRANYSRSKFGQNGQSRRPRPSQNKFLRKRKFSGDSIDISRFINKAEPERSAPVFVPQYTFSELKIEQRLKGSIEKRGFKTPTPIQEKTIPHILAGKDVIGLANTGTGKTGAFLIPLLNKIIRNQNEKVLIVVPTRELAFQIQEELSALSQRLGIFSAVVVGGANIQRQIGSLRSRHNFVIGTPGRLKDLLTRKVLDLSKFNNVVLDEADRMLDMGFIPDIRLFLSLIPKKRQILLFSATFEKRIEDLTREFLNNPEKISVQTKEISRQIDQDVIRISSSQDKVTVLHEMLAETTFEKVLVFTRTKYGADKLSRKLCVKGFRSESIHGDKPQNKRLRALKRFKEDRINILVATDVAARGLDIPNVSHVINFDIPATYEDYIHRIGRTGRADKKGIARTFV